MRASCLFLASRLVEQAQLSPLASSPGRCLGREFLDFKETCQGSQLAAKGPHYYFVGYNSPLTLDPTMAYAPRKKTGFIFGDQMVILTHFL